MPAITHFHAGVSTGGNTAGSTGSIYREIVFVGSNNITLSQSTNGQFATVSILGESPAGGAFSGGVSTGGNTAGATGITGTQLVFVGSDNITLSQTTGANGGTISIIGAAGGGTVSSATTVSSVHSANVVGADAGRYALEGHQHAGVINLGASNVGVTAGNTTVRHGNFVFAGSNAITVSQETAAAGSNTLHLQGPRSATTISAVSAANVIGTRGTAFALEDHQHAGVFSAGASNVGSTAGNTTVVPGRFVFAGSNAVTVSQETAANSLNTLHVQGPRSATTISAVTSANVVGTRGTAFALEDHQHEGVYQVGLSTAGNTAGNTFLRPGRIAFQGSNAITLSGETAANSLQTIHVQGPRSATTVSSVTTGNVAGTRGTAFALEDHQHAGVQRVGVSNIGNTAGNTTLLHGRSVYFSGQANITLSQVTDANHDMTIGISAAAGAGGNFSGGASNLGNTAGSTGITGTRLVFVGSDNITLSQSTDANGGTLSLFGQSPAGGAFSGGVSTGGNTAGSTGITGTRLVFAGVDGITLSQSTDANGGTITIEGPNNAIHLWNRGRQKQENTAGGSLIPAYNRLHISPLNTDGLPFGHHMTVDTFMQPVTMSDGTATMSAALTHSWYGALYTLNGSTLSIQNSFSASVGFAGAATNNSTAFAGVRFLTVHSSNWSAQPSLHPQSTYWFGMMIRSSGSSLSRAGWIVNYGAESTTRHSGYIGVSQLTDNTQAGFMPFWGLYNTTTTAMPAAIQNSDINKWGTLGVYYAPLIFLGSNLSSGW